MNQLGGYTSGVPNSTVSNSGITGNIGSITLAVGGLYIVTAFFNYNAVGISSFSILVSGGGATSQNIPMTPQIGNTNYYLSNTTQYVNASGTGVVYVTATFAGPASITQGVGYIYGIRIA